MKLPYKHINLHTHIKTKIFAWALCSIPYPINICLLKYITGWKMCFLHLPINNSNVFLMAFKVRYPQCQILLLNTFYYYSNNASLPAAKSHFYQPLNEAGIAFNFVGLCVIIAKCHQNTNLSCKQNFNLNYFLKNNTK